MAPKLRRIVVMLKKLYPWIVWLLASCFLFYKYLLQVSPTVMVPELMSAFHLDGLHMGNLAAFYFYAYLCMQLPAGLLLDHFSPRKMVTAAIAVCACGALVFAKAETLGIAEIGRLLIGLGGAFSAVGTMKLITVWFKPKQFALVSGLMMTLGMLGGVGGEAPLAAAVANFTWRHTLTTGAIIGFILAIVFFLIVRDNKQEIAHEKELKKLPFFTGLKAITKNKQSWLIALYSGLAFAPISAFGGLWGIPYLMQNYHHSRADIAGIVSLIFIGFAAGSPLAGWLSDKINRRKPIMFFGTAISLICLTVIIYSTGLSVLDLAVLLTVMGFFSGWFFVSFATMREINDSRSSGTSIGFINMFNALCGALSEPLIGHLLDLHWGGKMLHGARVFSLADYHSALSALPIGLLVALIILLFVKETRCVSK